MTEQQVTQLVYEYYKTDRDSLSAYRDGINDGANFVLPQQKWIAVEDGLPENGEIVWAYCEGSVLQIGFANKEWVYINNWPVQFPVTHWQEIIKPQPPIK